MSSSYLNLSKLVQSIMAKKEAWAETTPPKSIPVTTEASLLLQDICHVNEEMGDGRLKVRMRWKPGCCIGIAVDVVIKT